MGISTIGGKAAHSGASSDIEIQGTCQWTISGDRLTIRADRVSNESDSGSGAIKLVLWFLQDEYDGDFDRDNAIRMGECLVSRRSLEGNHHFPNVEVSGDLDGDPPSGDYYSIVRACEFDEDGSWYVVATRDFDGTTHWDHRGPERDEVDEPEDDDPRDDDEDDSRDDDDPRDDDEDDPVEELRRTLRGLERIDGPGDSGRPRTAYRLPASGVRQRIFDALAGAREAGLERKAAPSLAMEDLFRLSPLWSGDATDGLSIPIGFEEDGDPLRLEIGDANVHGLVGGITGSGKSNLLHAIIHSMCRKYSPAEVELHLLDFKDGMEFKVYSSDGETRVWLPHAKTISTHNDPAYALSLFDELQREAMRRKRLFGRARSYLEFRRSGGRMPRILVLVDEFHKLFEGPEANDVAERILQILKQGRSYGIHLLMSTQTLSGLDVDLGAMKGQISARLALRGNDTDGILDVDNDAATKIERPMCVYNDRTGQAAGNHLFRVPFIDVSSAAEAAFREEISAAARQEGFPCAGRVFRGTELPRMPDAGALLDGAPATTGLAVRIGVCDDYLAQPAFAALDEAPNGHLLAAAPAGDDTLDDAGNLTCNGVWDGLKATLLASLAATRDTAVLLYDPLGGDAEGPAMPPGWVRLGAGTREGELLEALKALAACPARHRVLVVDNWAKATRLHPREDAGSASYLDEDPGETARSVFASAFATTDGDLPFHAVLLVRNFAFARQETLGGLGSGCDLLKGCSQRIAVNLAENDLAELFPTLSMRGSAHRILAGSSDSDEVFRFLPFRSEAGLP